MSGCTGDWSYCGDVICPTVPRDCENHKIALFAIWVAYSCITCTFFCIVTTRLVRLVRRDRSMRAAGGGTGDGPLSQNGAADPPSTVTKRKHMLVGGASSVIKPALRAADSSGQPLAAGASASAAAEQGCFGRCTCFGAPFSFGVAYLSMSTVYFLNQTLFGVIKASTTLIVGRDWLPSMLYCTGYTMFWINSSFFTITWLNTSSKLAKLQGSTRDRYRAQVKVLSPILRVVQLLAFGSAFPLFALVFTDDDGARDRLVTAWYMIMAVLTTLFPVANRIFAKKMALVLEESLLTVKGHDLVVRKGIIGQLHGVSRRALVSGFNQCTLSCLVAFVPFLRIKASYFFPIMSLLAQVIGFVASMSFAVDKAPTRVSVGGPGSASVNGGGGAGGLYSGRASAYRSHQLTLPAAPTPADGGQSPAVAGTGAGGSLARVPSLNASPRGPQSDVAAAASSAFGNGLGSGRHQRVAPAPSSARLPAASSTSGTSPRGILVVGGSGSGSGNGEGGAVVVTVHAAAHHRLSSSTASATGNGNGGGTAAAAAAATAAGSATGSLRQPLRMSTRNDPAATGGPASPPRAAFVHVA